MQAGMEKMIQDMHAAEITGNPDIDFLAMMISHHGGRSGDVEPDRNRVRKNGSHLTEVPRGTQATHSARRPRDESCPTIVCWKTLEANGCQREFLPAYCSAGALGAVPRVPPSAG
jgi:hypothetical protein